MILILCLLTRRKTSQGLYFFVLCCLRRVEDLKRVTELAILRPEEGPENLFKGSKFVVFTSGAQKSSKDSFFCLFCLDPALQTFVTTLRNKRRDNHVNAYCSSVSSHDVKKSQLILQELGIFRNITHLRPVHMLSILNKSHTEQELCNQLAWVPFTLSPHAL